MMQWSYMRLKNERKLQFRGNFPGDNIPGGIFPWGNFLGAVFRCAFSRGHLSGHRFKLFTVKASCSCVKRSPTNYG